MSIVQEKKRARSASECGEEARRMRSRLDELSTKVPEIALIIRECVVVSKKASEDFLEALALLDNVQNIASELSVEISGLWSDAVPESDHVMQINAKLDNLKAYLG